MADIEREDLVPLQDLIAQSDMHPVALRRRVRQSGIPVWQHPLDRRQRLIRREDADALFRPRLVKEGRPIAESKVA